MILCQNYLSFGGLDATSELSPTLTSVSSHVCSRDMYSLYDTLLAQHSRQLNPVRCGAHTLALLHRYLEDVILENKVAALLVESFPLSARRNVRELNRVRELVDVATSSFFLITKGDSLSAVCAEKSTDTEFSHLELDDDSRPNGRFVVIADGRFSALIASPPTETDEKGADSDQEMIWTFEPDVVYSALEYLMARLGAEHSEHAAKFAEAVRHSMPKATSLQLTLSVTTKLARLLHSQAEREIAVNRIATAVRNSLQLDSILDTAAREVGRVLNASSCGIHVENYSRELRTAKFYVNPNLDNPEAEEEALIKDLDTLGIELAESPSSQIFCDDAGLETILPRAVVPLKYNERLLGILLVRSNDASRCWTESELLLLHTVADQVTVAVNQAHLFAQLQQQALTDALTDCYNRRALEMQLERDLQFATRMRQPLALLMLDLDRLKEINDRLGHDGGDNALRMVADCLRSELRGVDTPARYGGDEFAIILPGADIEGALVVAERLRARIETVTLPGVGSLSASIGVASFPENASDRETLTLLADRALYKAKRTGRNRVCFPQEEPAPVLLMMPPPEDSSETIHFVID